jgi:transposase-like protein
MGRKRQGLSVSAAAKITGMSESTVRRWIDNHLAVQAGDLPADSPFQLKGWKVGNTRERRADKQAVQDLAALGNEERSA